MPLTPDQIANTSPAELRERARKEQLGQRGKTSNAPTYISPHFGDGGWHSTPGCLHFNPRDIQPLGDHVLIELDPPIVSRKVLETVLILPDCADKTEPTGRVGTVLKIGPGAWRDTKTHKDKHIFLRLPMTLKPGDRVLIGPYADFESWDADYERRGPNIVLCQEADVRGTLQEKSSGSPN